MAKFKQWTSRILDGGIIYDLSWSCGVHRMGWRNHQLTEFQPRHEDPDGFWPLPWWRLREKRLFSQLGSCLWQQQSPINPKLEGNNNKSRMLQNQRSSYKRMGALISSSEARGLAKRRDSGAVSSALRFGFLYLFELICYYRLVSVFLYFNYVVKEKNLWVGFAFYICAS